MERVFLKMVVVTSGGVLPAITGGLFRHETPKALRYPQSASLSCLEAVVKAAVSHGPAGDRGRCKISALGKILDFSNEIFCFHAHL